MADAMMKLRRYRLTNEPRSPISMVPRETTNAARITRWRILYETIPADRRNGRPAFAWNWEQHHHNERTA